MGSKGIFDNPKPVEFMYRLIQIATDDDSIVLDFFSGSGTTAHALMKYNSERNTNLSFIMVQLPELVSEDSDAYKMGFRTIADIGEVRIDKAGERILADGIHYKENANNSQTTSNESTLDVGFKVFVLDSTNINPWDNTTEYTEQTILESSTVFKLDRSKEDVLFEIMLKYGVFDQPTKYLDINGKTMYKVGKRHMIVCLEDMIDDSDINEICKLRPRVVVFKEDGFKDDNAKINAEYNLKKSGVEEVKCI